MKTEKPTSLSDFPSIERAMLVDGAIRVIDGRWSEGFVDEGELQECVDSGLLLVEERGGMRFATTKKVTSHD